MPRIWTTSEEGTKKPNPSIGTTLPSYSRLTTATVTARMFDRSVASCSQSFASTVASVWAGNALITWSTRICSVGEETVSLPQESNFTEVHGDSSLTLTPFRWSSSSNLSESVCKPPFKDHVLQRSFFAFAPKQLWTEESGEARVGNKNKRSLQINITCFGWFYPKRTEHRLRDFMYCEVTYKRCAVLCTYQC